MEIVYGIAELIEFIQHHCTLEIPHTHIVLVAEKLTQFAHTVVEVHSQMWECDCRVKHRGGTRLFIELPTNRAAVQRSVNYGLKQKNV